MFIIKKTHALFNFAFIPNFNLKLSELSDLASDEDWNYKINPNSRPHIILFNYIIHTFERISTEGKIAVSADGNYACFNTGLLTDHLEDIFGLFTAHRDPNSKTKWFFLKFCTESDRMLLNFTDLPETANYFDEPESLIYDTRKDLRVSYNHIIDDNRLRFPEPYNDTSDENTRYTLSLALEGAVKRATKRVARNYKTAIPQFYDNKLQLLLPLSLKANGVTDLALVVERINDTYRANTCLTLDMAYNNARLLAKPDTEWLLP